MSTFTIGEVAERTGFSASALRYYEGIGLLEPAGRTPAGYRRYDDRAVQRLGFIARAKELGCSLEEIVDLLSVWDGDECGLVQRRLHDLVTEKVRDTERRRAELEAFARQLRDTAARLSGPAVDGPCDDRCACTTPAEDAVPVACTLQPEDVPARLAQWRSLADSAVRHTVLPSGGRRLDLPAGADVAAVAALVAAEQGCCAFLQFAITVDDRGVGVEVSAPPGADAALEVLLGEVPPAR